MIWRRKKPAEVSEASLKAFVRAGGSVSLSEWLRWDEGTQAAFERAGTAVAAERMLALVAAFHGEVGALVDVAAPEEATEVRLSQKLNDALNARMRSA